MFFVFFSDQSVLMQIYLFKPGLQQQIAKNMNYGAIQQ